MKKLLNIILIFIFILGYKSLSAKDEYSIKIKVKGLKDTVCYLANYYGDKQYLQDTVRVNDKGEFEFRGDEKLPGGIYLVVLPGKKYFEILIDKNQFFSLETDTLDLVKDMKVKGSDDNQLFYDYLKFIGNKHSEIKPLREALKKNKKDKAAKKKISEIDKEVKDYKMNLINENEGSIIAAIHNASRDVEVPEAPLLENGKKDSTFAYKYYKKHFFDYIDFSDDRILRTPIYHGKIERYLEKLIVPHPDSIIKEADWMIEQTNGNKEMFKYLVWYITNKYERSPVMGYDEIFVHMANTYYCSGKAFWAGKAVVESICKRSKTLEPLLLGKQAPNLIMLDTAMNPASMYAINKDYTVVIFWDPDCGHCKKEVAKLNKMYPDNKDRLDLEIYGVCSDTSMKVMKKYIREKDLKWINVNGPRSLTGDYHDTYDVFSTPVIYLLDKKKLIVAKRISAEQVVEVIERDIKMRKKQ